MAYGALAEWTYALDIAVQVSLYQAIPRKRQ